MLIRLVAIHVLFFRWYIAKLPKNRIRWPMKCNQALTLITVTRTRYWWTVAWISSCFVIEMKSYWRLSSIVFRASVLFIHLLRATKRRRHFVSQHFYYACVACSYRFFAHSCVLPPSMNGIHKISFRQLCSHCDHKPSITWRIRGKFTFGPKEGHVWF